MSNSRKQTYIVTRDFKTPEVYNTGSSYQSAQIGFKKFTKGQIISGELKHSGGKPAFVLVDRMTVVPLGNIKKMVTVNVVDRKSSASGSTERHRMPKDYLKKSKIPKIRYMDAILLGAVVGGVGFWFAEKKELINVDNPKAKLYAAVGGAALAFYIVYRHQQNKIKLPNSTK
jgi:hypothetical protein